MDRKEIKDNTLTGLVALAVTPILVGAVVKTTEKCYYKIANGIEHIKRHRNKIKSRVKA